MKNFTPTEEKIISILKWLIDRRRGEYSMYDVSIYKNYLLDYIKKNPEYTPAMRMLNMHLMTHELYNK